MGGAITTECACANPVSAEWFCICTFPLPPVCSVCCQTHFREPGTHFLLPPSTAEVIQSQAQFLQVQPKLLELSKTHGQTYALLPEIARCEKIIGVMYQHLLREVAKYESEAKRKLSDLKRGYEEAVNKAIQEACLHAVLGKVDVPENPTTRLMWEHDTSGLDKLVEFKSNVRCLPHYLRKAFQVAFRISLPGLESLNYGTFPTPIKVTALGPNDKVYQLEMGGSDSVEALKFKLEMESLVPSNFQCLMWEEKLLSDNTRALADYGLPNEVTLHLDFLPLIFVKNLYINCPFVLPLDDSDTVNTVEAKLLLSQLSFQYRIPKLYFEGKLLEDGRLSDYNIHHMSTLEVDMQITIKTEERTFAVLVLPSHSIKELKKMIEVQEGIPFDQQRLFIGEQMEELEDGRNLGYVIHSDFRFYMALRPNSLLIRLENKYRVLEVENSDSIEAVKTRIQDKEGTPSEKQILIFKGRQLKENSWTIAEYNLHMGSNIYFCMRQSMQIIVKCSPNRTITLDVNSAETITNVKRKILRKTRLPLDQQRLVFAEEELIEDRTIASYDIQAGAILYLEQFPHWWIYVQINKNKAVPIYVASTDTIGNVKTRIQNETGIIVADQRLLFQEQLLEDQWTVTFYRILAESSILLVQIQGNDPHLLVKTMKGNWIPIYAESFDTIATIKSRIHEREGEERLLYLNQVLEDHRTLADYHIEKEERLSQMMFYRGSITLYLKTLIGTTISLDVSGSDTILDVKTQIKDKEGVPTAQQRLVFAGKELEDDRTVVYYGLQEESVIYFLQKNGFNSLTGLDEEA